MSVTIPPIFTPIYDEEVSFERPVSEEVVRKIIQNLNIMNALTPIACVRCIAINIPGCPIPNPQQYQLCDGSEIDPATNSPLRSIPGSGAFTPNIINKYIRGAANFTSNAAGGTASIDLTHAHSVSAVCSGSGTNLGSGGDGTHPIDQCHSHTIANDLGVIALDLAHYHAAIYLKIN